MLLEYFNDGIELKPNLAQENIRYKGDTKQNANRELEKILLSYVMGTPSESQLDLLNY